MTRRQLLVSFTAALATLGSTVTLGFASRTPNGTLCGHIFGRGLRFGGRAAANPSGKYPSTYVIPHTWLMIWQQDQYPLRKIFTDERGYFEIQLPPGTYMVQWAGPVGLRSRSRGFRIESGRITVLALMRD